MKRLILIILLLPLAYAACVVPVNQMTVNESVRFCTGIYNITDGIRITKSNVELDCDGATLNGSHDSIGVFAQEVANIKILNCRISGYRSAVYLTRVEDSSVYDNSLSNNAYGAYVLESRGINLIGNDIFSNVLDGISLDSTVKSKVKRNEIHQNGFGIYSYPNGTGNEFLENKIKNNTFGIFVVQGHQNHYKDNTIELNKKNGLHLLGSEDEHIESNIIRYNGWSGLVFDRSMANMFVDNVVSENHKTGMYIVNKSRDNTCTGNLLKRNWIFSVYLDDSAYNNSIFGNEIYRTDIRDSTNATKNSFCNDGLMNKYYDDSSGPGCLPALVRNETVNQTINLSFDPVLISQKTIETILQGSRIDGMIEDLGLAKIDLFKELYAKTIRSIRLKKKLSVIEVFLNGSRQNHTRVSLVIEPNETMYNLSVYEKVPRDVHEEDIEFSNDNYTKINDYVYLWNFSVLDNPVNLSYVIKKLINGEPITFPLAQRVGAQKSVINQTARVVEQPVQPIEQPVEIEEPADSRFAGILAILLGILTIVVVMILFFKRSTKHVGLPHHDEDEIRQMAEYVSGQLSRGVTFDNMRAYLINLGYDQSYIDEIFRRLRPQ